VLEGLNLLSKRPQELMDYCRSREIVFESYCPLAKGGALTHPSIIQLAKKYGKTPAQICICWSIQVNFNDDKNYVVWNGIVTIPKSTEQKGYRKIARSHNRRGLYMKTDGCFQVTISTKKLLIEVLLIVSVFMVLTIYAFPQVFDFTIAEDDVEILKGMHDGRHVSWDPSLIV
ncbi:hypothetical protein CIB84_008738, partial [Bambusicola thoracicus]